MRKELKTRSALKELKRKHAQGAEDTKRAQGAEIFGAGTIRGFATGQQQPFTLT
jgi:hypothetical protein